MGLLETLGFRTRIRPDMLASPFSEGEISKIVWSDVFGVDYAPLDRSEAMGIPALSKARDLLCHAVASLTLVAVAGDTIKPDDKQPRWLYRTDGEISPYLRMMFTVDDLLFYGASLWYRDNGSDGFPLSARRIPFNSWQIDAEDRIVNAITSEPFDPKNIIYIPSHTAGLLDRSGSALRSAAAIGKAVEFRTKVPIPVMEISITDEGDIPDDEAEELVKAYNQARRDPDGATVLTPRGVTLLPHGDRADAGFMVEGRNAVRLDMGNITGVPGALLDGSTATATLTYSTTDGKRNEFHEYAVAPMLATITSRLSQDDCVPAGTRVEADLGQLEKTVPDPIDLTKQD